MNVREGIQEQANAVFPEEACGFVLGYGGLVVCDNVAEDPQSSFLIAESRAQEWWDTGDVVGVWHSHCFDPAVPSEEDQRLAPPGLQCWIYSVMDEDLGIYELVDGRLELVRMDSPE